MHTIFSSHSLARKVRTGLATCLFAATTSLAWAEGPGRGQTGPFETDYLKFIIDHHFSALRMTELAAGTDAMRNAAISKQEGTAPTPQTQPIAAKAQSDEIKSLARRNNAGQREEILIAQRFLKEWYGIDYQPRLRPDGQQLINRLERVATGPSFDQTFLHTFSRHHYLALNPTVQCVTGADLAHRPLERYCQNIIQMQTSDIDEMRHMLCTIFGDCDDQPFPASARRRNQDAVRNWANEDE